MKKRMKHISPLGWGINFVEQYNFYDDCDLVNNMRQLKAIQ